MGGRFKRLHGLRRLVSPTTAVAVVLAALVVADVASGPLLAVRVGLTVIAIAYLPGLYIVSASGVAQSRARALYAVGISIISTMAYGFTLNLLYLLTGLPFSPFSLPSILLYLGLLVVGATVTQRDPLGARLRVLESRVRAWPQPYLLGILLIFGGFLGAYYINNAMGNSLLIGVVVLTGVVAAVVLFGDFNRAVTQFLLYTTACTLLLQNLVLTPYLSRTGDTGFEYYFANQVLTNQVWNPEIYSTKTTSLYLNIFYPFAEIFSGLDLFNVIIYIFPFLFALIAVSLYQFHSAQFGATIAVASVLLYLYTDQFFRLLSRSTRSGMAILFISLFALALTDPDLSTRYRKWLVGTFLVALTVIHYGTAIVFGIVVGVAYIVRILAKLISGVRPWPLNFQTLVVYGIFILGWFVYIGSGRTFEIAVFNLYLISRRTSQGQVGESTTVQTASMELPSLTSTLIRLEYFVVILIASLVLGGLCLLYIYKAYTSETWDGHILVSKPGAEIMVTGRALALPLGGLSLLAFSFAPTSIFWINRLYMITAIFVLPYFFIGLIYLGSQLPPVTGQIRDVFAVLTVVVLLLNTGILGMFVWNGDAHQDTIDKNRIEAGDEELAQIQLYVNYYPPSDYHASTWLTEYRSGGTTVYDTGVPITWLSYFSYISTNVSEPPGPYRRLGLEMTHSELADGYIYVNKFTQGRLNDDAQTQRFQFPETMAAVQRCDRIYMNGGSAVHTTTCWSPDNATTSGNVTG